jgi:hypothetical protein
MLQCNQCYNRLHHSREYIVLYNIVPFHDIFRFRAGTRIDDGEHKSVVLRQRRTRRPASSSTDRYRSGDRACHRNSK